MSDTAVLQANAPDFDDARRRFLQFAEVVRLAHSASALRGMLLMDAMALGRSTNMLDILDEVEGLGGALCWALSDGLDEDGVPV